MKMKITLVLAIWLGLVLVVASRDVRNLNALEVQDEEERMMEERELEKSEPEEKEREDDELEERDLEENDPEERDLEENDPEERDLEENDPEERGLVVRQPQEREVAPGQSVKAYVKENKDNLGALGKSFFEAGASLIKIDYSQSAGDIAWKVADAIMPVIGAALAFIPVVGPIVSGIFLGVWSIISAIWGPKEENPMEKMINEMADKLRKEMDKKLSDIINLAIYGEIARNNYICNKYNYVSYRFADNFKNNQSLETIEAVNLKIYLNDCDNFLKDTAEAFVYDDYADVLWVAGAITTSVRLGFLAEIIKNGPLIGLTDDVLLMYVHEMKNNTLRQYEYFGKGYAKQNKDLEAERKKNGNTAGEYNKDTDYFQDVSGVEKASCALQGQFFYFDRELYPLGQPKYIIADNFVMLYLESHYRSWRSAEKGNEYYHLQAFFNAEKGYPGALPWRHPYDETPYLSLEYMNCFLGPLNHKAPITFWIRLNLMSEKNRYSYEFRLMYLDEGIGGVPILGQFDRNSALFPKFEDVYRKVIGPSIDSSQTTLTIQFIYPDNPRYNESVKLIDIPGNPHWKKCPYENINMDYCKKYTKWLPSRFKMYSVGTFNHHDEEVSGLFAIQEPKSRDGKPKGFLVGMEIIVRSLTT